VHFNIAVASFAISPLAALRLSSNIDDNFEIPLFTKKILGSAIRIRIRLCVYYRLKINGSKQSVNRLYLYDKKRCNYRRYEHWIFVIISREIFAGIV